MYMYNMPPWIICWNNKCWLHARIQEMFPGGIILFFGWGGGLIFGNLKMFEFLEDAPTPSVDPRKSLMNIEGTVQKHVQDLH